MTELLITHKSTILGGTPVFAGTRVPVRYLFEWLEGGETLEWFLDNYPSVTREQAVAALRQAGAALDNNANEVAV